MTDTVRRELVDGICAALGTQLLEIILYGSVARGDDCAESDVDIALLVSGTMDAPAEDRLSDCITALNLRYDWVFSVVDIDIATWQRWGQTVPYYQNVKKDGVVLWKDVS